MVQRRIEVSEEMIAQVRQRADAEFRNREKPATLHHLITSYLSHCKERYCPNHYLAICSALARLDILAGMESPESVDAAMLWEARELAVEAGCSRKVCNRYAHFVRKMFRWAEPRNLCSREVAERLEALEPLRRGQTEAHDYDPVESVPALTLKRTLRAMRRRQESDPKASVRKSMLQLRSMIGVQLRTGMRPAELCQMRWSLIDRSREPWRYHPDKHKTMHHGVKREIPIGVKAQRLIYQWCEAYPNGDRIFQIERNSYRWKVCKWLVRLDVPHWFPNQLRHNFATRIHRVYDEKTAQTLLNHLSIHTTRGYIDPDTDTAIQAIREIG